jgi:hypothetical protein
MAGTENELNHLKNLQKYYSNKASYDNYYKQYGHSNPDFDNTFMQDRLSGKYGTDYETEVTSYSKAQQDIDSPGISDIQNRITELTDPNSKTYSTFRNYLTKTLSGLNSTNAQLATTIAQGGSFVQAQEKVKAMQAQVSDKAISGTESYYLENQSGVNSLLSTQANLQKDYTLTREQLKQQKEQYESEQNSSFWSNIIGSAAKVGAVVGGTLLAGPVGGVAAGAATTAATSSVTNGISSTDWVKNSNKYEVSPNIATDKINSYNWGF